MLSLEMKQIFLKWIYLIWQVEDRKLYTVTTVTSMLSTYTCFLYVSIRYAEPGLDVAVHDGLGEGGVVDLVVTPAPEAEEVNHHVFPELLPVAHR